MRFTVFRWSVFQLTFICSVAANDLSSNFGDHFSELTLRAVAALPKMNVTTSHINMTPMPNSSFETFHSDEITNEYELKSSQKAVLSNSVWYEINAAGVVSFEYDYKVIQKFKMESDMQEKTTPKYTFTETEESTIRPSFNSIFLSSLEPMLSMTNASSSNKKSGTFTAVVITSIVSMILSAAAAATTPRSSKANIFTTRVRSPESNPMHVNLSEKQKSSQDKTVINKKHSSAPALLKSNRPIYEAHLSNKESIFSPRPPTTELISNLSSKSDKYTKEWITKTFYEQC